MKVPLSSMAKEKVTLTLDAENIESLRALVGARSLSASGIERPQHTWLG